MHITCCKIKPFPLQKKKKRLGSFAKVESDQLKRISKEIEKPDAELLVKVLHTTNYNSFDKFHVTNGIISI